VICDVVSSLLIAVCMVVMTKAREASTHKTADSGDLVQRPLRPAMECGDGIVACRC